MEKPNLCQLPCQQSLCWLLEGKKNMEGMSPRNNKRNINLNFTLNGCLSSPARCANVGSSKDILIIACTLISFDVINCVPQMILDVFVKESSVWSLITFLTIYAVEGSWFGTMWHPEMSLEPFNKHAIINSHCSIAAISFTSVGKPFNQIYPKAHKTVSGRNVWNICAKEAKHLHHSSH